MAETSVNISGFKDENGTVDVISFALPCKESEELQKMVQRIVFLDRRSLHMLGKTKARIEVRGLLVTTVQFLLEQQVQAAAAMLEQAYQVYDQHIQSLNRLRYVLGVAASAIVIFFISCLPQVLGFQVTIAGADLFRNLTVVVAFAGMGAITSVLTRLAGIDLSAQTSKSMVFISGASRPVAAVCFSLVVYIIMKSGFVEFHVGRSSVDSSDMELVAGFLCGFSERFAQDILGRVSGDASAKTA
jgi:hypothetical protein